MSTHASAATAWTLVAPDGTVLGRLEAVDDDMPWYECRFTPTAAFDRVAPLFAEELALLNRESDMEAWQHAYDRIVALALELRPEGAGAPVRKFILHVNGDRAWFRC